MNKLIKKIFLEKARIDKLLAKIEAEIEILLIDKVCNIKDLETDYTRLTQEREKLTDRNNTLEEVLRWIVED